VSSIDSVHRPKREPVESQGLVEAEVVVESFVELEVAVVAVDCVESVDEVDPDAVVAAPVAACARATVA
jgi:hypothetical protein